MGQRFRYGWTPRRLVVFVSSDKFMTFNDCATVTFWSHLIPRVPCFGLQTLRRLDRLSPQGLVNKIQIPVIILSLGHGILEYSIFSSIVGE